MITTDVIDRLTQIHSGQYTYHITSDVVSAKDRITVVCNKHGVFTPTLHDHLYNTSGCPRCTIERHRMDFVARATATHGDRYDYSCTEYVNNYTPVDIRCKEHGVFSQVAGVHVKSKVGCPRCSVGARTHTASTFANKAAEVHGRVYDYSHVTYVNTHTKVRILCKNHGEFMQTPDNHLHGAGCPKCAGDTLRGKYVAGHNKVPNKSGQLYVARFTNDVETFIKVGITTQRSMFYRYGKKHAGYDVECVYTVHVPIRTANEIEKHVLTQMQQYKYRPHTKFGGYTECLDLSREMVDNLVQLITEKCEVRDDASAGSTT